MYFCLSVCLVQKPTAQSYWCYCSTDVSIGTPYFSSMSRKGIWSQS